MAWRQPRSQVCWAETGRTHCFPQTKGSDFNAGPEISSTRTFAHYARDGLIRNMFPEGQIRAFTTRPMQHCGSFTRCTAYVENCQDKGTLELLLPILKDIVRHHLDGTRFGIKVDPRDGLLTQGAEGYALTWMDAKVGEWVVTPRRGKGLPGRHAASCITGDV
jgi:glycogen debranching enzyme